MTRPILRSVSISVYLQEERDRVAETLARTHLVGLGALQLLSKRHE